jgi:peptide methionine sulfoxide reductase MsrB
MPFIFRIGNWLIFKITKMLYKMEVFDTQCGYRAFTSDAYKKVRWHAADYSMESEMIANAGKHHLKHVQVPIDTIYADKYKGTTIIDGVKVVLNMVWWKIIR